MRVILLSARVQESDVSSGMDAGADAYLPKPFRARDLVTKVRELLPESVRQLDRRA
jgi:DNA-binding response OmpR family regulator